MKEVKLKRIEMHYFKGIKGNTIEFGESETVIAAPNGAGKSSIVDAFFWCLWGKNAAGQSDQKFSIKTLDKNGEEIPHVNHEVELTMTVDGDEQTFRRVLVPEYTKDDILKGNRTEYYWNSVPMKKSEYDQKVADVIKETVFKLITSPYAFLQMEWQKQRETLMRMAGEVKDDDVEGEQYSELKAILRSKTLEEHNKEIAANLKRVNDAMQNIPARIDEVLRGIPELDDPEMLDVLQKDVEEKIAEVDDLMRNAAKSVETLNADRNAMLKEINDLKFKQSELLQTAQAKQRNEIHASNAKFKDAEMQKELIRQEDVADINATSATISALQNDIDTLTSNRTRMEYELQELRTRWTQSNAMTFQADEFLKCPLYGHLCQDGTACSKYDEDQGGAFERFQQKKAEELSLINEMGQQLKTKIADALAKIAEDEKKIQTLKEGYDSRLKDYRSRMLMFDQFMEQNPKRPLISDIKGDDLPEWVELGLQIEEKQARLSRMVVYEVEGQDQALARRAELVKHLDDIKQKKADHQRANAARKRVDELTEEQRALGNQKTALEMQRQTAKDFEIAKMNMITDKINDMFKLVKWQMFQKQVNGEEVPACICTFNGVPWNDVNEAQRLDAGIDVAYTLGQSSKVSAPMFIDGAEKSLSIYNPGGQRILLRVADSRKLQIAHTQMNL